MRVVSLRSKLKVVTDLMKRFSIENHFGGYSVSYPAALRNTGQFLGSTHSEYFSIPHSLPVELASVSLRSLRAFAKLPGEKSYLMDGY